VLTRKDDLQGLEGVKLLRLHLQNSAKHSPSASVHVLSLDALRTLEITFWTARDGPEVTQQVFATKLRNTTPSHHMRRLHL
jgi:hypothetical protein